MKTVSLSFLALALTLPTLVLQFSLTAQAGGYSGGGGDSCQDRIEDIRNDISDWIQKGGSSGLKFPKGISLSEYNQRMQAEIALTRLDNQASISCVNDPELVKVESAEKICKSFSESPSQPKMVCFRGETKDKQYISGFMGQSAEEQYFTIHHELAVLAGLEDQKGQATNYPLSNQISGFLDDVTVKKLSIVPSSDSGIYSEAIALKKSLSKVEIEKVQLSCFQAVADSLQQELIKNGIMGNLGGNLSTTPIGISNWDFTGYFVGGFSFKSPGCDGWSPSTCAISQNADLEFITNTETCGFMCGTLTLNLSLDSSRVVALEAAHYFLQPVYSSEVTDELGDSTLSGLKLLAPKKLNTTQFFTNTGNGKLTQISYNAASLRKCLITGIASLQK